jgi:hypothetical protein
MHSRYTRSAVFIWMASLPFSAHATSAVGSLTASAVLAQGTYQVTATTTISSGTLITGGLNLLRVDGAAPVILGVMHDDGQNGDAVANDGIYTFQFTAASVSQMQLQASAAFRGVLRRQKSTAAGAPVVTPTITQVSPNSGRQGQQGLSVSITGQNTHFSQGTTTANFGAGITVTQLTVNSATSATAILNIPGAAIIGTTNLTMTSGDEAPVLTNGFTVTSPNQPGDVVTWHYDTTRSGVQPNETTLTPSNVNSSGFGKLAEITLDGQVDGQVLYLHQVNIPNLGTKNVVYVATENDTVYALDASTISGSTATVLWHTSVLLSGETAATSLPCGPTPTGVMATPVIDRARNAIYVTAMSQTSTKTVIHRLHALDLATGAELFGGPITITATYPGTGGNSQNGTVTFDPSYQHDRAALLNTGTAIYTVWSGLDGDCGPYSPWVISYNADTLAQTGALDLAPSNYGGGMWMGGAGPAMDASGNVYTITGNGFGGTQSTEGGLPPASYNNSMVKLSPSSLSVLDYFTPSISITDNNDDLDFGSVGPLLFDAVDSGGTTHHLAAAGGKDGQFYVVDQDNMGEFNSGQNNIYQQFTLSGTLNFSTAVYFNGTVYVCPGVLKAYAVSNAKLAATPTQSSTSFRAVPTISSSGATNGLVWALDTNASILYAYDATSVTAYLYNSNQAGTRDHFAAVGGHFITPTVVDGKVYFGTGNSLVVFGLLP